MTPRGTAAKLARVNALAATATRILGVINAALDEVPEADREAVAVVLAGGFAADVVMGAKKKNRALHNIMQSLVRAGVAEGLVEVAGDDEGCGDPDCPACSGKEAGERGLTCH